MTPEQKDRLYPKNVTFESCNYYQRDALCWYFSYSLYINAFVPSELKKHLKNYFSSEYTRFSIFCAIEEFLKNVKPVDGDAIEGFKHIRVNYIYFL